MDADIREQAVQLLIERHADELYLLAQALRTGRPGHLGLLRHEGDYWTAMFAGKTTRIKQCKGIEIVGWLLRHPHHQFLALELDRLAARVPSLPVHAIPDRDLSVSIETGDEPLTDHQARLAYQRRLTALRDDLADAQARNDLGATMMMQQEIGFIEAELRRATGLGGRERKWPCATEKARVNVANAIRMLRAKLRKQNPELVRYLANTIRTGRFCSFEPDPLVPVQWIV